jgi:HK97 family phage prohead protease
MPPTVPAGRQARCTRSAPTLVKRADGKDLITGYASVFYDANDPGTEYPLWDDLVERIRPGAFDRALSEKHDCRALKNHDPNLILGRTGPGTLRLSIDAKGLKYECDPPDTQAGRDTVAELQRGDLSGSSFCFLPTRTTWEEVRDPADANSVTYVRWIEDLTLFDVGPVTYPAYESSTSGLRSAEGRDDVRAELDAWRARGKASADRDYAAAVVVQTEIALAGG